MAKHAESEADVVEGGGEQREDGAIRRQRILGGLGGDIARLGRGRVRFRDECVAKRDGAQGAK